MIQMTHFTFLERLKIIYADGELYRNRIFATEWQIDTLAYELYGLTEKEIGVVEGLDHE